MKQVIFVSALLVFIGASSAPGQTVFHPPYAQYGIYDTDGIPLQVYRQRRAAVMAIMDSGSIAIFHANDPDNRNGDVDYKFRQNDNFLYLTGCNETNAALILAPGGIQIDSVTTANEIFFVNAKTKNWSGDNLGLEGAKQVLGFGSGKTASVVLSNTNLKERLPQILQSKKILYYTPSLPDLLVDPISNMKFVAVRDGKKVLGEKYPDLTIKGSGLLVNDLRSIKSPDELAFLQKSIEATVSGYMDAMKICKSGMFEYELQAIIEYSFTRSGCEFYGFPSIVSSGPNALSIHYDKNRRQMNSGELVLMDIGAEYHGYSADLTRTIPVNGKYSFAQKEIYELVLNAQNSAINEVKPGIPMNVPEKKALEILGEGMMNRGIIHDKSEIKKYCPHGISHFIGLDVHEFGTTKYLAPGMVLTIEPGVYIPDSSDCDKKYWGIGIRIEDDVLVTGSGCKVLTAAAPRTVKEIETFMKQGKNRKENTIR